MSRSFLVTRRELARLNESDYASEAVKAEKRERLQEAQEAKRDVKRRVRQERRGLALPTPSPVESVPFYWEALPTGAQFPASAEDVRAVLRLLPRGAGDGLRSVVFRAPLAAEDATEFDPFSQTASEQILPGVWTGRYLGAFYRGCITLRAYVYDETALPPGLGVYLRLLLLATLVHEVAHLYDWTLRIRRGRWRMDAKNTVERYAEQWEYTWTQNVVIPYLEETYPADVAALRQFLHKHGGLALPLSLLVSDPRITTKSGLIPINAFFPAEDMVGTLWDDVQKGVSSTACRLAFARYLHYRDHYKEAVQILRKITAREPKNAEAWILLADIAVHEERYSDARRLARHSLTLLPVSAEAWEFLASACEGLEQWQELHSATERALRLRLGEKASRSAIWRLRRQRARALIELGNAEQAEADIAHLEASGRSYVVRRAQELRERIAARKAV